MDDSESILGLVVSANVGTGGYRVGAALLSQKATSAPGEDEEESGVRRALSVFSFEDSQFLLSLDALLVRERPSVVVVEGEVARVTSLLVQHKVEAAAVDLARAGWARASVGDRVSSCLRFVCGEAAVARHDGCLRDGNAARSVALVVQKSGLYEERAGDRASVDFAPGFLGSHMRLDSAAAEAVNLLPQGGGNSGDGLGSGSLLEVLGGPCKTAVGRRLVEHWLRQPSLCKAEIEARYDVVGVLAGDGEARDAVRVALGGSAAGGKGGKVPDLARMAAKLVKQETTLLDLHKLHVLASRVLPDVVDAVAAVPCEEKCALASDLGPGLRRCARDLRGFCEMADATLDLDFLPEVLLKASVDEDLVAHAQAMRRANGAVLDAHERVNRAFDDSDLPVRGFSVGGDRGKWPVKVDKDGVRGRVFRSPRRFDEKSLNGVDLGGGARVEILSYLKNGVYFTTPDLARATAAFGAAQADYKRSQKALTAELVKTAATYAPVFLRCSALLARLDQGRKRVIHVASTWAFSKRYPRGKPPRFEFAPRHDRSSKNEPHRVENDRATSLAKEVEMSREPFSPQADDGPRRQGVLRRQRRRHPPHHLRRLLPHFLPHPRPVQGAPAAAQTEVATARPRTSIPPLRGSSPRGGGLP